MRASRWFVVFASLSALTAAGCSGPPEIDGETTAGVTYLFPNDKAAYDFFVAKGLTSFQAAGIVGNLDQESGVDPGAVQYGGGPGRGIAQWSVGGRWDTSANDNVLGYAKNNGQSSGSLSLQLSFIWYELTTYGYGFAQLKATTNITDATVVFMDKYEICGTCAQTQRISYAKAVLNAYGATPAYAAKFVSQTWPYASLPPFTVKCGETVAANIVLKNMGTKAWDGSTRLGTTMQRDRASVFAGADWLAPDRAAAIQGTVAPGANGTFAFSFHGPTGAACIPGVYEEYFGVVQEGVAWFSDNGQGGPPDNQIEAVIEVVPGDPGSADDMGGASGDGGGGVATGGDDGATGGAAGGGSSADDPRSGETGSMAGAAHGGCAVGGSGAGDGAILALLLAYALIVARRRNPTRPC